MKLKQRSMAVLLAATLLAFSLEAGAFTHLNQLNPGYHVTLKGKYNPDLSCYELFRVLDNGTVESKPFSVPSTFFLVVTDFEWRFRYREPNESISLYIFIQHPNGPSNKICFSSAVLDENGKGGGILNLVSGFVAAPGSRLTVPVQETYDGETIFVRGYLAPPPA
jgi:hypothetical protein